MFPRVKHREDFYNSSIPNKSDSNLGHVTIFGRFYLSFMSLETPVSYSEIGHD
jgi:hypothetical protein